MSDDLRELYQDIISITAATAQSARSSTRRTWRGH
jgi:hypothetical protein